MAGSDDEVKERGYAERIGWLAVMMRLKRGMMRLKCRDDKARQ